MASGRGGDNAASHLFAAVPNVPVTAILATTGVSTKVVTNESGNYVFPNLQPGTYTITCEAGFARLR